MHAVYCCVVPGCPDCERSPSGVCAAHNSNGAFMQGIDGEWVEIEEDGPLDFLGACETILAEEDEGKPFSSGEVNLRGTVRLDQGYAYAPRVPGQLQSRMGWECPRCHACHAPHVDSCPNCLPQQVSFPVYPIIGDPVINPITPYIYPTTIPGTGWDSHTISVGGNSSGTKVEFYSEDVNSDSNLYAPYVPTEISCEYSDQYE